MPVPERILLSFERQFRSFRCETSLIRNQHYVLSREMLEKLLTRKMNQFFPHVNMRLTP